MPIDSSIPLRALLGTQQPVDGPLDNYGKGLQLTGLMRQNQLGELQLSETQRAQKEQEAARQIFAQGLSPEETGKRLLGVSPTIGQNYLKFVADTNEKNLQIQKTQGDIAEQARKKQTDQRSLIASEAAGLKGIQDPTQRAAAFNASLGRLAAAGVPAADVIKALHAEGQVAPTDQDLDQWIAAATPPKEQQAMRDQSAEEQRKQAEEARKVEEFNAKKAVGFATGDEAAFQNFYKGYLADNKLAKNAANEMQARQAFTKANKVDKPTFEEQTYDDYLKSPEAKKYGASRLGFDQYKQEQRIATAAAGKADAAKVPGDFEKTGDAFLDTIPAQWRTTVKKIAHYDEDPTKVASMRGGSREQIMQWVNQVNPEYDSTLFGNRAPTRKAFTTGTQGQQINAINTAIGHIDQVTKLSANLKNGSFVPGNEFYNWAKTTFGGAAVTNFDTLKDALAGEVASVLSKGAATVSGIAEAKDKIKAASSPAQLAGYVKTLLPIMGSKLGALNYQYHQAMGPNDPFSALSPESKSILKKNGFDPENPLDGGPVAPPKNPYR